MKSFKGKSILITGGTGSFGKRFAKRVLEESEARRVIIYSRDELKQYDMAQEEPFATDKRIRFFIGDVRDRLRLELAMRDVQVVVHAAALKQVPTAEYNPFECISTNVIGAENIIHAALRNDVANVVALSTDKAVNPVNLYGASKLASDKIFVAANNVAGDKGPRFSVVRYGNVLGSRGSVIPLFRKLIAGKADFLPITDNRMTRFWITLDQSVSFVLNMIDRMKGGETYIPKIPSMRIVDLAKAMAPDMPRKVVGIRPGEKLHEIMITADDSRNTLDAGDCYIINPSFTFWDRKANRKQEAPSVPEDFVYSSDTNTHWLSPEDMNALLSAPEI